MPADDVTPRFSSLAAMVLATSGVAIGLGNVWRFPYMMAEHGGIVFLLVYLVIVFALGIPALMAEWALGRHAGGGPAQAFKTVGMPLAPLWSGLLLLTITMAASYYGVILGQVLAWATASATAAASDGADPTAMPLTTNPWCTLVFVILTAALGCGALGLGVTNGIERLSKVILPLCLMLVAVLIIRSLTLEGALDGLRQFLAPRPEKFTPQTVLAALGQAFFSIGLGGTLMVVYGSYMRRRDSIPVAAVGTALADLIAAVLAGMAVIPAVIALGVPMDAGPRLLFVVMPEVFARMPLGELFGLLFFASIFLIALLSLMAAYEVMVDFGRRLVGLSRRVSLLTIFVVQVGLSIPAIWIDGYIGVSDLIWGSTMHPFGSALAVIALLWCAGRATAIGEIRGESTLPFAGPLYYWLRYVVPVVIVVILVHGWWPQIIGLWARIAHPGSG